ncbi:S41 family peptidase [candidate division KSB1 bacterium]|nr:S41 family peptidase [candidate division KSB1 bacterium]
MRHWTVIVVLLFVLNSDSTAQSWNLQNANASLSKITKDWQAIIDSTWGDGLPTGEKLAIFDTVWTTIDEKFACFQNLDVDWLALKNLYRPEIERGVSRGRFAAIMNHLSVALKEPHTIFLDTLVNVYTKPEPGVPLLFAGGWGDNGHFGAGLTPLPDSSLLVYMAVSPHPIGLEPGDIVLGYNGIPWKRLYKQLLEAELPITIRSRGTFRWGANQTAFTHSWLMSAGMNWHLFDTIDFVKYNSGDTLHAPTQALMGHEMSFYCTEQLPVPGVPMPDREKNRYLTWGIVEGTNIGYVYVWSWIRGNPSQDFFNAIDSLMHVYKTDGLILDYRYNPGGYDGASWRGLNLLFKSDGPALGFARRSDPYDHFKMETMIPNIHFPADPSTFFDKPIAVLTGPGGISATDVNAFWMKAHPRARLFGKTTASGFCSPSDLILANGEWNVSFAWLNAFIWDSPNQFLTHAELDIDEPVWFTPDDVYQGRDTVVETAIKWINDNTVNVEEQIANIPVVLHLSQNYPNPFNPSTTITYTLPKETIVILEIFNLLGQKVRILVNERHSKGVHSIVWEGTNDMGQTVNSGFYVYRLKAGDEILSKKMLLMR